MDAHPSIHYGRARRLPGTRPRTLLLELLEDRTAPAGLAFSFTLDDPGGQLAPFPLLQSNLEAAGRILSGRLAGQGTIDVVVRVDNTQPRFTGGTVAVTSVGSSDGFTNLEPGTITEARTGNDPNGAEPDLAITVQTTTYLPTVFLDPNPDARTTPIPDNMLDGVSLALHEMLHGFGIIGYRRTTDPGYGTYAGAFRSTYDALTAFGTGANADILYFHGPRAMAVYGGPVPLTSVGPSAFLTSQNFFHLGNPAPRPGSELEFDLMNGLAFYYQQRYSVSNLDLGILADIGLPLLSRLSVDSPSVQEGDTGERNLAFTVSLSTANPQPVTVNYATANGTATSGSDYTAVSGTLTFAPGETTRTVLVPVLGDALAEANETVLLQLSNPSVNAALPAAPGTGTILDDEEATVSVAGGAVPEGHLGTRPGSFLVTLSRALPTSMTVQYATADGTATSPGDYTATTGQLTIPAGATSALVFVPIVGDSVREPDRSFSLTLSNPTGGVALGVPSTASLTILDDDARLVVAPDAGGPPTVKVFDSAGQVVASFEAYGSTFTGGVRVATADITGDGNPEIFTAPGPTGAPFVNIFDGVTFAFVRQFQVYGESFTLGVNLAVGNVTGDARPEIVVAPESGGEPFLNVVDSDTGQQLRSFLAYGQTFTLGVRLALANTDAGNGSLLEVLTAPQAGGEPFVNHFNAAAGPGQNTFLRSFLVYGPTFTGGLYLAGGNVNNTGLDDFIVGPGSGGDPFVNGFDGTTGVFVNQVQAYGLSFRTGVRVALLDVNGDGTGDILTGPGPGGQPYVQIINGLTQAQLRSFLAFPSTMTAGLFVVRAG